MRLEPINIQQVGDELAIAWNDGTESFLKLELLRRALQPRADRRACAELLALPRIGSDSRQPGGQCPSRAGLRHA